MKPFEVKVDLITPVQESNLCGDVFDIAVGPDENRCVFAHT